MQQSPEYSRPDNNNPDRNEVALYARAARELGTESADGPLRERIREAVWSDPPATRRVLLPVRPSTPWKGAVLAATVSLPLAGLALFGLYSTRQPSFADVEKAMVQVKTATWNTTVEMKLTYGDDTLLTYSARAQSWAEFSSTPHLATRMLDASSPQFDRDHTLSVGYAPIYRSGLYADRFAIYPQPFMFPDGVVIRGALDFRSNSKDPGYPASISDGRSFIAYSPDRRWYYQSKELTPPPASGGDTMTPDAVLRRNMLFPTVPTTSPIPLGMPVSYGTFYYPNSTYLWTQLKKEWQSDWRSTRETFQGKPVIRFESKAIRTYEYLEKYTWTMVEDWTVRVDPGTHRVVWREIAGSHDGTWSYRLISDNFRYNDAIPADTFKVPVPEIGKTFSFFDQPPYVPNSRWNSTPRDVTLALQSLVDKAIDTWNRKDLAGFDQLWDYSSAAAEQRPTDRVPEAAAKESQDFWHDHIQRGIPWKNWRLKSVRFQEAPSSNAAVRSDASDPFPPINAKIYIAIAQIEAVPDPGQTAVTGKALNVTFRFCQSGNDFRIHHLEMPARPKFMPTAKAPVKSTLSDKGPRPAGRP